MDVFKDGLHVLLDQWLLVSGLLGIIFSGVGITLFLLKSAAGDLFSKSEYVSLGISGWLLPVLLLSFFVHLFPAISKPAFITFMGAGFLCMIPVLKSILWTKPSPISFGVLIIFLFSIVLNLAFISRVTFPAYFDSVEHYRIIKSLVETPSSLPTWPAGSYYHIGYHVILAAIVQTTQTDIIELMLVIGQLALSMLTLSLFFIIKSETTSTTAALFTTLLAGFGWYMPAHAINWGKYPAIFGLIGIIFVINLLYLILPKNSLQSGTKKLIPVLMIALITSTTIHTRSLVVCGLFAIALVIANKWETLGRALQRSLFGLIALVLFLLGLYLRNDGTFIALLSSYWKNDFAMLIFVLLLSIFAAWKFPKFTFLLLLFTTLLMISVFIPVYGLFGYPNLFLLDRPYAQMLLFMILCLLGGLGLAGLFNSIHTSPSSVKRIMGVGAFGFLVINAIFYQEYYPSTCCQLAGRDDVAAFSWIQQELPPQAKLLIASQDLPFTPNADLLSTTAIDAGIWVGPITGRGFFLLPFYTDFTLPGSHEGLCNVLIDYIYVGNRSESFNESSLIAKPEWYQGVFILPEAKIYQLIGCL